MVTVKFMSVTLMQVSGRSWGFESLVVMYSLAPAGGGGGGGPGWLRHGRAKTRAGRGASTFMGAQILNKP
jgi:hypothetical protein